MEVPVRRIIRFGVFEVDLRASELRKHGTRIRLQQQPLRVLTLLLEHPGELVTREDLRQAIWPTNAFGSFDEGLDAAIYKLRSALGDSAERPRFVETLPRRGYRFIGAVDGVAASGTAHGVHPLEDQAPAPTAWPAPRDKAQQTVPMPKRGRFVWAAGLAVSVALLLTLNIGGLPGRLLRRATTPRIHSIAVLPLENLSGDPTQEYFADGMTEALTTHLGGTRGLRVISHTSAMHYKGTLETLPEIGRQLHVDAVVEGAVLRAGNRVRVTAQLVEAPTDRHLWAETYERDLGDALGLQDAIARAIANEVQIRLLSSQPSPMTSARTRPVDPDAYDLYLRGRSEWNEWTEQGVRKSIEYFEQAVQKDASHAAAWAGLSDAYQFLGQFNLLPPKVAWAKAKVAALRAIQLDETLSEAHASLASVWLHKAWSWSGALKEFQRAIALNPNNAWAHYGYGYVLSARGQFDVAIAEMKRAQELDPLSPYKQNALAVTLYRAGRYEEALRYFREVPDPDVNSEHRHRVMAAIYERKGRLREAMAEWLTALSLGGKQEVAASVERAHLSSGFAEAKRTYLRGDLREAQRRAQNAYPRPLSFQIAVDYALLGERDRAFEWLERAFREQEGALMFLTVDNRLEDLRADPRFRDLARRIGLLPDPGVQDSTLGTY